MQSTCVKCGADVDQPATGRPRIYRGVGCRRAAEHEIRRLNRAIEATEVNIRAYQAELGVDPVW
jgi:hypothetical protein